MKDKSSSNLQSAEGLRGSPSPRPQIHQPHAACPFTQVFFQRLQQLKKKKSKQRNSSKTKVSRDKAGKHYPKEQRCTAQLIPVPLVSLREVLPLSRLSHPSSPISPDSNSSPSLSNGRTRGHLPLSAQKHMAQPSFDNLSHALLF